MEESDNKPKTKSQLKKDAKRNEKLAKFEAKRQKEASAPKPVKETTVSAKKDFADEEYTKETKEGDKKDIGDFPKAYSPRYVEAKWYQWWEKQGYFKPEYSTPALLERYKTRGELERGKFVMVIPPPNVTGYLHLGHALTNSIEDALTRWHRQRGDLTLWVPGCDHAGIATQVVVEKKIARERHLSRHDLGRDAFVAEIWKWKQEKGDGIYHQLRALGSSCDWDRACFTMDKSLSAAVAECFVRLHTNRLIYRAERLVNWSCTLCSAISDIEVDKKELKGRTPMKVPGYEKPVEFGILHSFAYPLVPTEEEQSQGIQKEIIVSTTRLETMLGDVAVAVHPEDARYKALIGRRLQHPFYPSREMRIIADTYVDKEFGTGAVKITPAHDPNDYDIGKRHNLPFINIFDDNGNISIEGAFFGQPRFAARANIETALTGLKLFHGCKENPNMVVPLCSRSKDIVEPRLKPQWFVKCAPLAKKAADAVRNGQLRIIPASHERTWFDWLDNCLDWCISRQLWWGHRIPAYAVKAVKQADGSWKDIDNSNNEFWFSGHTPEAALQKAMQHFHISKAEDIVLEQDEDVLDTWFSSGLFPFSVFQWPNTQSADLRQFYPTTLLETGFDILFFWVARMVMLGLEMTDQLPFDTVYLHAMVRDAHGKKMSKSLGNALDPLDVIDGISLPALQAKLLEGNLDPSEVARASACQAKDFPQGIPTCGTDALRFGLCDYTSQGKAINLDVLKIQAHRCFCNKLWQACRYLLFHALADWKPPQTSWKALLQSLEVLASQGALLAVDKWMLACLTRAVELCNEGFLNLDFSKATQALFELWMHEFCDVYLEYSKNVLKDTLPESTGHPLAVRSILWLVVRTGLLLLHPFMPFVTEELFQRLTAAAHSHRDDEAESISVTPYPEPVEWTQWRSDDNTMKEAILVLVNSIRSFRTANDIPAGKSMQCDLVQLSGTEDDSTAALSRLLQEPSVLKLISQLARCDLQHVLLEAPSSLGSTPHVALPLSLGGVTFTLLLYTEGVLNVEKLLTAVQTKQAKLLPVLKKLEEKMNKSDYTSKVPASVQEVEADKLREMRQILEQLDNTAASLAQSSAPVKVALQADPQQQALDFVVKKLGLAGGTLSASHRQYSFAAYCLVTLTEQAKASSQQGLAQRCALIQWLCWVELRLLPALIQHQATTTHQSQELIAKCFADLQQSLQGSANFAGSDYVILAVMQWYAESHSQHWQALKAVLANHPNVEKWILASGISN